MAHLVLRTALVLALGMQLPALSELRAAEPPLKETGSASLWELAKSKQDVHRFSTLMTAQNVRDHLATEDDLAAAIAWCRQTGVTKVSDRHGFWGPLAWPLFRYPPREAETSRFSSQWS